MVSLLVAGGIYASAVPKFDMAGNLLRCEQTGRVSNWDYSVEVPGDFKACFHDSHDVLIPLAGRFEDRVVACNGSFNAAFMPDLQAAVKEEIEARKERGGFPKFRVLGQQSARLGMLPAVRIRYSYRSAETKDEMVGDLVVAVSSEVWEEGTAPKEWYTVELTTPRVKYEVDRRVFELILATWRREQVGV